MSGLRGLHVHKGGLHKELYMHIRYCWPHRHTPAHSHALECCTLTRTWVLHTHTHLSAAHSHALECWAPFIEKSKKMCVILLYTWKLQYVWSWLFQSPPFLPRGSFDRILIVTKSTFWKRRVRVWHAYRVRLMKYLDVHICLSTMSSLVVFQLQQNEQS